MSKKYYEYCLQELNSVVKPIVEQKSVWVAVANYSSYSSSLCTGQTYLYILTPDSNPDFSLSVKENRQQNLISEIKPIFMRSVALYSDDFSESGKVLIICDAPFKVWERHRGHTGERSDNRDRIHHAEETKDFNYILSLFSKK